MAIVMIAIFIVAIVAIMIIVIIKIMRVIITPFMIIIMIVTHDPQTLKAVRGQRDRDRKGDSAALVANSHGKSACFLFRGRQD